MLTFTEFMSESVGITFKVAKVLCTSESKYQKIEVFENEAFGKVLALDGKIQASELDEFLYHEMLTHVPLAAHRSPKSVLIIGGGDGGCIREALKHGVSVKLVEIDEEVVSVCKENFGIDGGALDDASVEIVFMDAFDFLKGCEERFDVILVDATDPIGEAEKLFSEDFYRTAFERLNDDGVFVTQSGSPVHQPDVLRKALSGTSKFFPIVRIYVAPVPSYLGLWSFVVGSKKYEPETPRNVSVPAKFYDEEMHAVAFKLAKLVKIFVGLD
ncbi:MAG: spermidine synthase [Candidatus Alkanophagales archaeon]|nr:MAG: spermidine synthase [Candidatus Alkanophagales archaeon]